MKPDDLVVRSLRGALEEVRRSTGAPEPNRAIASVLYDRARCVYDLLSDEARRTLWLRTVVRVGMLIVALAIATSAAAADLFVEPISPMPGAIVSMGFHYLMVVRTLPGALCSVDIEIPGRTKTVHASATKADAGGEVSWRAYTTSEPGERHASATCDLNGRRVTAKWTYTVR